MKVLDNKTKFAHLGKPGTAFSPGFKRRLDIVEDLVDLEDKVILDLGCGEGVWLNQFAKYTKAENVFGSDIDPELIGSIALEEIPQKNLVVCPAEKLDFADNKFDIVFANEVLEHVEDDQETVKEVIRVLKPGGYFVFFTPNRGWPFEQHGIFLNGKYIWGNIPLLPWLPKSVQRRFAPHVRNYWNGDIRKLFADLDADITYHKHVFPGFDGLTRRFGSLGRFVKKTFHGMESTPLHNFGISHIVVVKKS